MKVSGIVGLVIMLAIAGIITAAILPTALNALADVTTTKFSTATAAVWALLGLGVILCVALAFLKYVH